MRYRLIALDLDGTLLNGRKVITPRTSHALFAARERGVLPVIVSGRTVQSAQLFSRQIGGGPVIGCNGAAIVDTQGEMVQAKGLPLAPLRTVLEQCRLAGVMAECYTPDALYLDQPLEQARTYFRWVRPHQSMSQAVLSLARLWRVNRFQPVRSLLRWIESKPTPTVLKVMIIGPSELLGHLAEVLHRAVPGLSVTSSGADNLEVMAASVTKASGLQALSARLKIPREAILAFGDSDNDREMLTYAGMGVAMGNATATIKSLADRVTGTCDEDGIASVIEELCLR